jgi:2'-5' RNA ligase
VVLLVPEPVATAVDGLRRAFSDPALEHVAPHITLVPPVNVRTDDLAGGLGVLRAAAAEVGPLDLVIGPVTTFEGEEHVAYLEVRGDDRAVTGLRRLQHLAFRPPFERQVDHDFVPHVTLTQGVDETRLRAVVAAASGWEGETVCVDALHLLEEHHPPEGKRWTPIADVPLGPRRVVGRGGLEVELTAGQLVDPEAAAAVTAGLADELSEAELVWAHDGLTVVARLEGQVVGVAHGRGGTLKRVWVREDHEEYVRPHLLAAWSDEVVRRDDSD